MKRIFIFLSWCPVKVNNTLRAMQNADTSFRVNIKHVKYMDNLTRIIHRQSQIKTGTISVPIFIQL